MFDLGVRRHAEHDGENHFLAGQVVRPESGKNGKFVKGKSYI